MADPGVGGNEHINIDVDFHVNGAEQATQSVHAFRQTMQALMGMVNNRINNGNIFAQTAAGANQAAAAVNNAQHAVALFGFAGNAQKDKAASIYSGWS